jgi:hypothetical protein
MGEFTDGLMNHEFYEATMLLGLGKFVEILVVIHVYLNVR